AGGGLEGRLAAEGYAAGRTAGGAPGPRDGLAATCESARQAELEARLAVRTVEERLQGIAGRADALLRAAERERVERARLAAERARRRRQAETAAAVVRGAQTALQAVERSLALAAEEREAAERAREHIETELKTVR